MFGVADRVAEMFAWQGNNCERAVVFDHVSQTVLEDHHHFAAVFAPKIAGYASSITL
jgi:hypothetical protein